MRVRRNKGRLGGPIFYREMFTVRPVTYKDYEEFNVYESNEYLATFDTLGAAIEYIKVQMRAR